MARTQMRLDAITGSLSSAEPEVAALDAASLQDVMDHLASGIKRLHGGSAFHSQEAGLFSQNIRTTGNMDVDLNLNVDGNALVDGMMYVTGAFHGEGAASMGSTLAVAGDADLNGALDVAGAVSMAASGVRTLLRGDLKVDEAADLDGALDVAGAVALGAPGGAADTSVRGDLSVDENASISGNLEITGNLTVQGDTVTVNVAELLVEDKDIVVAKDATTAGALDGAGMKVGSGGTYASLTWSETNSKWSASEQIYAPVLQSNVTDAFYLKSDADGDVISGTASQLVAGLANQFTGSNIAVAESAGVITYSLVAGTGVFMDGEGEIAIGQAVGTGDSVEFAGITDSSLTASRLMASDASKGLVSADLAAWVAGTANQVAVADDADGSITLSLPQDIHTAASPQFAALNIGTDHDMLADGANLKLLTAGEIKLEGADGAYMLAEAGDRAAFTGSFGASETIIGAINSLAATSATFYKHQEILSADMAAGVKTIAFLDTTIANAEKRIDVYVNGQLLSKGASADYDYVSVVNAGDEAKIDFKFDLKADDAIVVISR